MNRCLIVTSSYPSGGPAGSEAAGAFVRDFAASLSEHIAVTVVAPARSAATTRDGNARVTYFSVPRMPLSLLNPLNPTDWRSILIALNNGAATVAREAENLSAEHILAFWALPCGHWARRCARDLHIPYSIWALGSDIWVLGKIPIVRAVLRRTLKDATRCYADGDQLKLDVERLSGRACDFLASARQLPCLPRQNFAAQPPYNLAFLGRWHPNKGVDILLEALSRLSDEDWALIAKIRIGGGGPLAEVVEAGVAQLQRAGRPIELHGFMGPNETSALLGWAHWLLIPSRIESIPVIFSDALQARCAILSNPAGDLAHLVERLGVGLCAETTDATAFTALLRRGLRTPPAQFRNAIEAASLRFNVTASARQFLRDIGFPHVPLEEN